MAGCTALARDPGGTLLSFKLQGALLTATTCSSSALENNQLTWEIEIAISS